MSAIASAEWDRLAKLLEDEGRLFKSDAPHLTGAAVTYKLIMEIRQRLKSRVPAPPQRGLFDRASSDRRSLPTVLWLQLKADERSAWALYRAFLNDLCLGQGTRSRVSETTNREKKKPGNRLNYFLQERPH